MNPDQKYIDQIKKDYAYNFWEVHLTEDEINNLSRDEVIDEICKFHPGCGVTEGYSWYIGGMADTGEWLPNKMKIIAIHYLDKLKEFLNKLTREEEEGNKRQIATLIEHYKRKKTIK